MTDLQDGGGSPLKSAIEVSLSVKRPDISQVAAVSEENQSFAETSTYQPENFEDDDGVKYCRLDTSNGSSSKEEDIEKINMLDSSVPFAGKSEGLK